MAETEIGEEIAKLTATAKDLGAQMKEAASTDESRYNELKAQLDPVLEDLAKRQEDQKRADREAEANDRLRTLEDALSGLRSPSKASVIGPSFAPAAGAGADHFFATLAVATNPRLTG